MMRLRNKLGFFKEIPAQEKRITIPTMLTLVRLVSAPIIVYAMLKQDWGMAFWLIVVSALTDLMDGYIARNFNQQTWLGACLDPIADKLLVLSIYFTLAFVQSPLFAIPVWFVFLVLIKELILISGIVFLYLKSDKLDIAPTLLGKLTMLAQVLFIIWLFSCYFLHWLPIKTYYTALGAVLCLVLSSLYQYARIGISYLHTYLK
jgi:cardiolipin synthase